MRALTTITRAITMALLGLTVLAGTAAAAPAAPTNFTANTTPASAIALAWTDNSSDEDGFRIEICAGANCVFAQIAVVPAGTVTFTDAFYPGGTYRVTAYNASGSSSSNTAVAGWGFSTDEAWSVPAATPLSGVAPLNVSFDGSASHALNGGVVSYDWAFGDGMTASGVQVPHTYTSPGVYAVALKIKSGGFGTVDKESLVITVTAPPLAAPNDLSASNATRGQIVLTWSPVASSATSLVIERCSGANCTSFRQLSTLTLASVFYRDSTVRRGTTYRYRLAASNGTSKVYSNIVTSQAAR
jgi:PKD repeat protein